MQSAIVKGSFLGVLGGALLLAGCGGGGGDSATPFVPPNISNTPVTIDASNQYEVADAAENGVGGAVDGGSGVLGVVMSGGGDSFSAFDFAESTLLKYASQAAAASLSSPAGIVVSQEVSCDSGSFTISANISDPNGEVLETDDTFGMSFDNCVDNFDGSTTSGSMSFKVVSGSLNFDAVSISSPAEIAVSFNNLQTSEMGETNVVHGGFSMSSDGATEVLSGDSLYVLETGGESVHLTSFTITNTTANTSTDTLAIDLTIASTDINGVITVQTEDGAPLVQLMSDGHPSSGTLVITGDTTTLTMVIISSAQVSLSLDSDNDGTPDANYPRIVTWTEIDDGAGATP